MKTVVIGILLVVGVLLGVAIATGEIGVTESLTRPTAPAAPTENSFRDLKIN